ncbi:MAG: hypothetical protein ABL956_13805 [Hyphomonadaceae bacterium]
MKQNCTPAHSGVLAIALALWAGVFGLPEGRAQSLAPETACSSYAQSFSSSAAFQTGLAEAARKRWQTAETCFLEAARDGDRDLSTSRPWLQSTKPEVWFNLGLARSNIRGAELGAMAAFQAYLELAPNSANAAAVKQQITQLHTTLKQDIRNAIARAASTLPAHPYSGPRTIPYEQVITYERIMSSNTGVNLAHAYLYAGDTVGAESMMRKFYSPDWRDTSKQHVGKFPNAWRDAWPADPDSTLGVSAYYALSRGDLAGARGKLYPGNDAEIAFACTARDLRAADDLKWIADRLRQRDSKSSAYLALLFLELGDRSFAENAAANLKGDALAKLQSALRGETPSHICESNTFVSSVSRYGRWWGTGRLWYTRRVALNPPGLGELFDTQKSLATTFDAGFNSEAFSMNLEDFAQTAYRLRVE